MYLGYAQETINAIKELLKRKSKEEAKNLTLKNLLRGLSKQDEEVKGLLNNEEFLKICKNKLDLNPHKEIIGLDELLKGYENQTEINRN